jgi:hypothetical protein
MRDGIVQTTASFRWGSLAATAAAVLLIVVPVAATLKGRTHSDAPVVPTTVHRIVLPDGEPEVPDGPNREQFTANCRLCHSPRLVLTQPRFSEKKWGEIVDKMSNTYGAPVTPDQKPAIIAYLVHEKASGVK